MCAVCRSDVIKDLCLLSRKMEHLSADLTERGGEILSVWGAGEHRWGYAPVQQREKTSICSPRSLLGAGLCSPQQSFWKFSAFPICENLTQCLWFSAVHENRDGSLGSQGRGPASAHREILRLVLLLRSSWWSALPMNRVRLKAIKVQGIPSSLHHKHRNTPSVRASQQRLTESGSDHPWWTSPGGPERGQESTAEDSMGQVSSCPALRLCNTS